MLDGYEKLREEFESLGFGILAGSVDGEQVTADIAQKLGFPLAHSMDRADAGLLGAWWDEQRGGYLQPSEFLLRQDGVVMASTYSNSPVGRMDPAELLKLVQLMTSQ